MITVKLAILAAKKEEEASAALWSHLAMLRRSGAVAIATPEEASFVAIILSARLVSDEMFVAQIAAARARGARIIPIRYSACEYLDILPKELPAGATSDWIATATEAVQDQLWASVAASLRQAIERAASA